jgi:sugar lactone lactonase YvrE
MKNAKSMRSAFILVLYFMLSSLPSICLSEDRAAWIAENTAQLLERVDKAPRLPLELSQVIVQPPREGWELGRVSSVAVGADGLIYVLHRLPDADAVVVIDHTGNVTRTWGKGLYTIPHSIRIDPEGNVWTVDSGNSHIYKFTPEGEQLLHIDVGEMPNKDGGFGGAADIAFATDGHLFVADGYGNGRVLEYDPAGQRIQEWGNLGWGEERGGPFEFNLVHGIAIDNHGIIYAMDRENGRIQRFRRDGTFLGMWDGFGKAYSIFFDGDSIWVSIQRLDYPTASQGWLMKLDPTDGTVLGLIAVPEAHSVSVSKQGEPVIGVRPNRIFRYKKHPSP